VPLASRESWAVIRLVDAPEACGTPGAIEVPPPGPLGGASGGGPGGGNGGDDVVGPGGVTGAGDVAGGATVGAG
jgi:hypothetical protein